MDSLKVGVSGTHTLNDVVAQVIPQQSTVRLARGNIGTLPTVTTNKQPSTKFARGNIGVLIDLNGLRGSNMVTYRDIGIMKNKALNNFAFLMRSSTDHLTPATGLTVTAQRSIDGGAFAACANSVSEVGQGLYKINLTTADTNGDFITYLFSATGADSVYLTVKTNP